MAEKRVSVRLGATGGNQVEAELESVGDAGERSFARLRKESEAASVRLEAFARRAKLAAAAVASAVAAGAAALVNSGLQTIDAQAKLAQSLDTTVESIQVLERAGELAGVSMSGVEQATKDLTRRLSQSAGGSGPAADALKRLGLSAQELLNMPLDERVRAINGAIQEFVPAAQRAAVAGQLFGEEGSLLISRLDPATIRQAAIDIRAFGVGVSEVDADQIERTNDAISRLGLITEGVRNRLTVALAPALERIADLMAELGRSVVPAFGRAIEFLSANIGRIASAAGVLVGFLAGRWVAGMAAAALSVRGLATALVALRGALIRTGFGALIVAAGELVYQFGRLVSAAGGFGEAMRLLGNVAREVWQRIKLDAEGLMAALASVWIDVKLSAIAAFADISDAWDLLMARFGFDESGFGDKLRGALFSLSAEQATLNDQAARLDAAVNAPLASLEELRRVMAQTTETTRETAGAVDEATGSFDNLDKSSDKASNKVTSSLDRVRTSGKEVKSAMEEVKTSMGQAFSAILSGATTAQDAVKQLLQTFAGMAADRAFNALFSAAIGSIGSALGGGITNVFGGPSSSAIANVASGAGGMSGLFQYANGTDYHPGGWAMVGERGREIVNLPRGAQVLDAMQTARAVEGAGGVATVRLELSGDLDARIIQTSRDVAVSVHRENEPAVVRKSVQAARASNAEQKFQ